MANRVNPKKPAGGGKAGQVKKTPKAKERVKGGRAAVAKASVKKLEEARRKVKSAKTGKSAEKSKAPPSPVKSDRKSAPAPKKAKAVAAVSKTPDKGGARKAKADTKASSAAASDRGTKKTSKVGANAKVTKKAKPKASPPSSSAASKKPKPRQMKKARISHGENASRILSTFILVGSFGLKYFRPLHRETTGLDNPLDTLLEPKDFASNFFLWQTRVEISYLVSQVDSSFIL